MKFFRVFSNLHEISNLVQFRARFSAQNHNRNELSMFLTFFKIFIFSQKMSHDVQKWPQFNVVPDFSWVCGYDFRILQILWCRNHPIWAKSLDEISQKSQKSLKNYTTSKSQEGPRSTTRAELLYELQRRALRVISQKSQKNLKRHTTSKSQEGPRSTTRAELLYGLQRRALRVKSQEGPRSTTRVELKPPRRKRRGWVRSTLLLHGIPMSKDTRHRAVFWNECRKIQYRHLGN